MAARTRLYGVDLDYKPNRQSAFYLFGAASEDAGRSGDAGAFGTGYGYTARSVRANVDLMESQGDFNPGAGFSCVGTSAATTRGCAGNRESTAASSAA